MSVTSRAAKRRGNQGSEIGRFRILDVEFGVRARDRGLGEHIGGLLRPFRTDDLVRSWYDLVSDDSRSRQRVLLDGATVLDLPIGFVVGALMWHLNQRVMLETRSHLMVHAAVASLDGHAVVLPGDADAGKSTLVAALVAGGLKYLSDEAAAVDLTSRLVQPYPRAIALERGSWSLLPSLEPADLRRRTDDLWLVDPEDIRPGATGGAVRCRLVVFPKLRPGATTRITPMNRADALRAIARRSTNLSTLGTPGFLAAHSLVEGASCWELELDGLRGAVELVRALLTECAEPR